MDITILYSSGGGNTKLVVNVIAEELSAANIQPVLVNASVATPEDMTRTPIQILAAPTYDHGVLHTPYERYLDRCNECTLEGHQYAIVGLGDNKYDDEYNMESAPLLIDFVKEQGGSILGNALKINKSPVDQLDTVRARTKELISSLASLLDGGAHRAGGEVLHSK